MIGSKVVLTYKRKRLSSRPGLAFENECRNSFSGCQTLEVLTTPVKQEGETFSDHNSEYERKDPEKSSQCALYNGGSSLMQCENSQSPCDVQDVVPSNERDYLLSQQAQDPNSPKDATLTVEFYPSQIPVDLHTTLLHSSGESSLQHNTEKPHSTDASSKDKPAHIPFSSCSYMKSGGAHDDKQYKGKPSSQIIEINASSSDVSHPSFGKRCSSQCTGASVSKETTLEAINLLLKDKSCSSCEDTVRATKFDSPLITFSRRSRNKRTVDRTDMEDRSIVLEKYDPVAATGSNTIPIDVCSVDRSTKLTGNNPDPWHFFSGSQDKRTSEDVDLHKLIETERLEGGALINGGGILNDTPPVTEPAPGNSPKDATKDLNYVAINEDKQAEVSKCHVSAADKSQIISNDGLASLVSSKPLPESSGMVDCKITLESSSDRQPEFNVSETHRDSTDSTSRSHSTVLHELPSRGRVLDLLDDRIGETSFARSHHASLDLSNGIHVDHVDFPSGSTSQSQTSKKNFLQLFPDEGLNGRRPSPSSQPETSLFMGFKDRPTAPTSNGSSTAATALFPLSLRTEARSFDHIASTSVSPWSNFDLKSREPIRDPDKIQYPSDPETLTRHKMMLDNILSKASAIKASHFFDNFEPRNTWLEEELDFLWIGVRRHGRGNWDAMLRDPQLHFSSWRSPRDLAQRWDDEQSKLLNNKTPRNLFDLSLRHNPSTEKSNSKSTVDFSLVNRPAPTNLATKLPHWLREAVSRPTEPATNLSGVSYTGQSGLMQWINQPFLGSSRTAVGPIGRCTSSTDPDRKISGGFTATGVSSSKPEDLIVIESDASSEETISDDHSVLH